MTTTDDLRRDIAGEPGDQGPVRMYASWRMFHRRGRPIVGDTDAGQDRS